VVENEKEERLDSSFNDVNAKLDNIGVPAPSKKKFDKSVRTFSVLRAKESFTIALYR
jgi:hypothetical protein